MIVKLFGRCVLKKCFNKNTNRQMIITRTVIKSEVFFFVVQCYVLNGRKGINSTWRVKNDRFASRDMSRRFRIIWWLSDGMILDTHIFILILIYQEWHFYQADIGTLAYTCISSFITTAKTETWFKLAQFGKDGLFKGEKTFQELASLMIQI